LLITNKITLKNYCVDWIEKNTNIYTKKILALYTLIQDLVNIDKFKEIVSYFYNCWHTNVNASRKKNNLFYKLNNKTISLKDIWIQQYRKNREK